MYRREYEAQDAHTIGRFRDNAAWRDHDELHEMPMRDEGWECDSDAGVTYI